jgi:DNA-binding GntR family transcriptional regulator
LELSSEHGVGRTPLREALRLLEADGYVRSEANRGISVTPVNVAHAEDLYALRLLIEPPLLSALAPAFSASELKAMRKHVASMERADRDVKGFQENHLELHLVVLERYGAATRDIVLDLYRRVQRIQRLYMSRPRVAQEVVDIDRRIVDALSERDGDRAKRLMQLHLIDWAVGLILDVEPDHRFDLLVSAASGVGITIDTDANGRMHSPVHIRWRGEQMTDLPHTSNVIPG